MEPQPLQQRRPRKARTWLRTREIERLRILNLQLDVQALRTEIRLLQETKLLLQERHEQRIVERWLDHSKCYAYDDLTDADATRPRRRRLSWDNNGSCDEVQNVSLSRKSSPMEYRTSIMEPQ